MSRELRSSGSAAWLTKTAPEIRSTAAEDGSVLVLPVGSVEQHGHHLPVSTDTLLVEGVTAEATDALADELPVVVAPTVWSGYSPHHLEFGGTITAEFDTGHDLLSDVAASALENAFDVLVFVNGHGGNTALVDAAVSTVGRREPSVEVLGVTYFDLATDAVNERRTSEEGGMAHGGEFETSLMLHLHPDLVREEEMRATNLDEPYEKGDRDLLASGPVSVYRGFGEYSESGAIGDPTVATAEKGAAFLDAVAPELADLLRAAHERNR